VLNRIILAESLAAVISKFKREELIQLLISQQVPAGAVRNMEDVFETPQSQNRLVHSKKEGREMISVKGNAFEISY
jgi:crotonobetainyl-CoA:carnitine CoA-transferase CaiB-like acyl-CoA transferase